MKAILLILSSLFLTVGAYADADCEKALKQAEKTCKADHNCKVQYMTVSGFDVVYTNASINCRGSKSQTGQANEGSGYFPTKDRNKSGDKKKKKSIRIED